jgi:hypothetical protein
MELKMGQAKNRKAEIEQLKNQPQLYGFGAFYKDLDDDGVSIQFSVMQEANLRKGFTKMMYTNIESCVDGIRKEIAEGTWTVDGVWEQLREAIVCFNFKHFGTNTRPKNSEYVLDVLGSMDEIIVIMGNIWYLTEVGQIQNDNYNGMNFVYAK